MRQKYPIFVFLRYQAHPLRKLVIHNVRLTSIRKQASTQPERRSCRRR